jgi:hypothetical protein
MSIAKVELRGCHAGRAQQLPSFSALHTAGEHRTLHRLSMSLARALCQAAGLAAIHDAPASGRMLAGACLQQLRGLAVAAAPSNQMQLIKQLREQTGAPIGDVKTALQSANWDLGEATKYPCIAPALSRRHLQSPPWMPGRRRCRRCLPAAAPSSSSALSPVVLAVLQRPPPQSCASRGWRQPTRRPRGMRQKAWWALPAATAWRRWWRWAQAMRRRHSFAPLPLAASNPHSAFPFMAAAVP